LTRFIEIEDELNNNPEARFATWVKPECPDNIGELASIRVFNFKLVVIQKSMYEMELLIPKFDVYELNNYFLLERSTYY